MLRLPAVFSDNMVLQRRTNVLIWGEAEGVKGVEVSLAGQTGRALVRNGRFEVKLNPMEAGGPYELQIKALYSTPEFYSTSEVCGSSGSGETENISTEDAITYKNVLVGEVWLAGGQSNMELELQNSDDGREVAEHTTDDFLRFYYTPKVSYICDELFEAEKNSCWMKCEPGATKTWSAVAYYWAVRIRKELNVPVGIIGCNWGGTYAHNWVSRESLLSHEQTKHFVEEYEDMVAHQDFDEYLKELEEYREYYKEWVKRVDACYAANPEIEWARVLELCGENRWPGPSGPRFEYRPYGLYESMLKRVAPYTIKGALYYQGESDENNNETYDVLLANLISEWRRLWRDDELAFSIVQLPVHAPDTEKTGRGWGGIRRAQDRICRTIRNTSLTVITDCGNRNNIHPTDKRTVGERLAENTLKDIYGISGHNGNGPCLAGYEITGRCLKDDKESTDISCCEAEGKGIWLHFANVDGGFYRKKYDHEGAAKEAELERIPDGFVLGKMEGEASGFEIGCMAGTYTAGADGTAMTETKNGLEFYPAVAVVRGNGIFVYNAGVDEPVCARYGNDNYFRPIFLDKKGCPIVPFWI